MHVRGFTRNPNSDVPPERRGTVAGVIDKVPYLKELGITMVELLPVQQFDPQEGNYWGYMPLNFFAPHASYASDAREARDEFRAMVPPCTRRASSRVRPSSSDRSSSAMRRCPGRTARTSPRRPGSPGTPRRWRR